MKLQWLDVIAIRDVIHKSTISHLVRWGVAACLIVNISVSLALVYHTQTHHRVINNKVIIFQHKVSLKAHSNIYIQQWWLPSGEPRTSICECSVATVKLLVISRTWCRMRGDGREAAEHVISACDLSLNVLVEFNACTRQKAGSGTTGGGGLFKTHTHTWAINDLLFKGSTSKEIWHCMQLHHLD